MVVTLRYPLRTYWTLHLRFYIHRTYLWYPVDRSYYRGRNGRYCELVSFLASDERMRAVWLIWGAALSLSRVLIIQWLHTRSTLLLRQEETTLRKLL